MFVCHVLDATSGPSGGRRRRACRSFTVMSHRVHRGPEVWRFQVRSPMKGMASEIFSLLPKIPGSIPDEREASETFFLSFRRFQVRSLAGSLLPESERASECREVGGKKPEITRQRAPMHRAVKLANRLHRMSALSFTGTFAGGDLARVRLSRVEPSRFASHRAILLVGRPSQTRKIQSLGNGASARVDPPPRPIPTLDR